MRKPTPSWRETWWLIFTLPLGLTTWIAFLYAGSRTKRRDLMLAAGAYGIAMVVGFVMVGVSGRNSAAANAGAAILLMVWMGGIFHAAIVRRSLSTRLGLLNRADLKRARQELERREQGRQLLAASPSLARQIGVGRPDVPGSDSYGLIDPNHAGLSGLTMLPGLTEEHAQRIITYRNAGGSFVSAEDLVLYLDLPHTAIGPLRDVAVFDMGA